MISYSDFVRLLTDTAEFDSQADYIADRGGSVPLDDTQAVCKLLQRIWIMGRDGLTIQSIMEAAGKSLLTISKTYGLPYRTSQDWKLGNRQPPRWQLPLLAYAVLSDLD